MLHGSLLGDADSRTDPAASGGSLPRHPVTIGENRVGRQCGLSLGHERKTIVFLIDGNTRAEGKLAIGSQAAVEYRTADGNILAPASSLEAR